jgi:cobalt-zinc-cadmium efflux system membrane fusion protein
MFRFFLLLTMSAALTVAGCKRPAETQAAHTDDDGHDYGNADGDGHDHEAEAGHVDEVVLTAQAIEQYEVTIDAAQLWQLRPTFVVPARVGFNTEAMAHVGSPLPGRAVELKVRLGSDVKAGDPLVVVESPELGAAQSDFLIRRTAAETAGPTVDLAKATWDRARNLYDSTQGVTLTEVQQREAEHRSAMAALKSAQAEAVAAENKLHLLGMTQEQVESLADSGEVNPRFTIMAPITGQVVQREVTLGELVSPEREALLVLADLTTLWVLADVPEARLVEVAVGAKTWVRIGGVQGQQYEGAVAFISPMVDASTRTAQVRIEVRDGKALLKPGMFAQVEIVSADPNAADPPATVAVPEEAIQTVEGGPAVFVPVPGEANTFAKRPVTIGKAIGGLVPVYSGLVDGEQFVAAGSFILKAELGKSTAEHAH